jgi:hypothetical protein
MSGPSFDAVHLAAFLGILVFLVAGANQVRTLMAGFKEQPPPSETYVTLKACQALHAGQDRRVQTLECTVMALSAEMKADRDRLAAAAEQRAVHLHDRINDVLKAVSELRGEINQLNNR